MNQEKLEQLKQERQRTMVELVYASQEAYAQLEQARKEMAGIKRWQILKKRSAKQNVAAKVAKMNQIENAIESAHQKFLKAREELEN
jgi:hypothetical protein